MNKEELKPCPFCGGEAKRVKDKGEIDEVWCAHCPASNSYYSWQQRTDKPREKKLSWQDILNTRKGE